MATTAPSCSSRDSPHPFSPPTALSAALFMTPHAITPPLRHVATTEESSPFGLAQTSVWHKPKSLFFRGVAACYDCPFMPPPAVAAIHWQHQLPLHRPFIAATDYRQNRRRHRLSTEPTEEPYPRRRNTAIRQTRVEILESRSLLGGGMRLLHKWSVVVVVWCGCVLPPPPPPPLLLSQPTARLSEEIH